MQYEVVLPKNEAQLELVMKKLLSDGKRFRHVPEINWWFIHYYLQGARNFENVNYSTGTLDVSYVDSEGLLSFRYDDITAKFQSQIGRLLQINLSPRVGKRSVGLDSLRNASIAQVALDFAFPASKVEDLQLDVVPKLTKYGCLGLAVWAEGDDMGIDVVPPWEILPIPPNPVEDNDVRGLIRHRSVPLDWIQSLDVTPHKSAKVYNEMERVVYPKAEKPAKAGETQGGNLLGEKPAASPVMGFNVDAVSGNKGKKDETTHDIVEFVETYIWNSAGYLRDYYIFAGGKHLFHKNYNDAKLYVPLQIVRDIKTGGFWGRSFVSTLLPLNQEMEFTLGRLLQNVQDIDAYGMLVEPTSSGVPSEILRSDDGIKRVRYEPDYMSPEIKPYQIKPVNAGTGPVNTAKIVSELTDKIANQPNALMQGDAPGRVDNSKALGFLFEVSNVPLTSTAVGLSIAVSNCYRVILGIAGIRWPKEKLVSVTMLDDTLAGISLDPTSGTMKLEDNNIPHPDEVEIGIKATLPKSKEQEKMELKEALATQTIDLFEYRITIRKKGIELPVGNEAEWQNYRRATLENIMLFGDGQTPGKIIVGDRDIHEIHMRVLQPFMARPEYYLASPEVREKFEEHFALHELGLGILPEGLPNIEDAAMEQDLDNKALEQAGGGVPPEFQ